MLTLRTQKFNNSIRIFDDVDAQPLESYNFKSNTPATHTGRRTSMFCEICLYLHSGSPDLNKKKFALNHQCYMSTIYKNCQQYLLTYMGKSILKLPNFDMKMTKFGYSLQVLLPLCQYCISPN